MVDAIERSGKATASLVLGILSFCFWIFTAIPGLIAGNEPVRIPIGQ